MKTTLFTSLLVIITSITVTGCIGPFVAAGAVGGETASAAGNSISVGQQVDDSWIKSQINAYILKQPQLTEGGSNVGVTAFNGIVLLLGQVPTTALKEQLAKYTSNLKGVRIVYNQLTVGKSQTIGGYANDSWVTTKVKANMIGKVNMFHFTVVTEQGIVYLLGRVTKDEGNEAARIASLTSGVKKVVKVFDLIKSKPQLPQAPVKQSTDNSSHTTTNNTANTNTNSASGQYTPGSDASD